MMKRIGPIIFLLLRFLSVCGQTNKIDATGDVGIGTLSPKASLHVNGAGHTILIGDILSNNYPVLKFWGGHSSEFAYIQAGGDNGAKSNIRFTKYNSVASSLDNFQVYADKIFFKGIVGIGIVNGRSLLHIASGNNDGIYIGKDRDKLNWDGTGQQPGYHIRFAGYRDVANYVSGARISALRTNTCCSGKSQGMELAFYVTNGIATNSSGDVNLKEALRINDNGNIAIGKSSADYKLDVEGTIRADEIRVEDIAATNLNLEGNIAANQITVKTNGNTADFVFSDTYNLKDLTEVENYIKTHKHLPDIPGAEEMEASGVNLAEMNKLLLQKVEELTLYVIQQKEERKKEQGEREALEEALSKEQSARGKIEERLAKLESLILGEKAKY